MRQYARTNEIVQGSIDGVIKDIGSSPLASRLRRDLDDLPRIVAPEDAETERYIRAVIEAMVQEWFCTYRCF